MIAETALEAETFLADPAALRRHIAAEDACRDRGLLHAPKADPFAYRTTLYRGFKRFPERLRNYVLATRLPRAAAPAHQPVLLDIEVTSRCNFRCSMCQVSEWPNGKRAEDLGLAYFKALIDAQPTLTEVKLQGMGEPLLHRDFFDMVDHAAANDLWIRTTVNGSLLHARDNDQRLVDSGIGEVQISIDGATKDVFEAIRRRSNFDLVTRNVTRFNARAESRGRLLSRMWVTVQQANRHQLFDFVELAKRLGFRRLTFSLNLGGWGQDEWQDANRANSALALSAEERRRLIDIRGQGGLDITVWEVADKYRTGRPEDLCPAPFLRSYVTSDLRLVPCGGIGNPEIADLGDARDVGGAWHAKRYQGFRNAHLVGAIPKYCRHCYELEQDHQTE